MALEPQASLEQACLAAILAAPALPGTDPSSTQNMAYVPYKLNYSAKRMFDGKPPPGCGNVFVSVWYDGQRQNASRNALDETYGVYVTTTLRFVQPADRWEKHRDDMEKRNNAIRTLIHKDTLDYRIVRAAAALGGLGMNNDPVKPQGWVEALKFERFDAIQPAGPQWFRAESPDANDVGISQTIRFALARRIQDLRDMDGNVSYQQPVPGTRLWFRGGVGTFQDTAFTTPAVLNNATVDGWQDQSGNGDHATQNPSYCTLSTNAINGLSAINPVNGGPVHHGRLVLTRNVAIRWPWTLYAVGYVDLHASNSFFIPLAGTVGSGAGVSLAYDGANGALAGIQDDDGNTVQADAIGLGPVPNGSPANRVCRWRVDANGNGFFVATGMTSELFLGTLGGTGIATFQQLFTDNFNDAGTGLYAEVQLLDGDQAGSAQDTLIRNAIASSYVVTFPGA